MVRLNTAIRGAAAAIIALATLASPATAQRDVFLERAADQTKLVPGNTAAEDTLFPAVLDMQPCPVPHQSTMTLRYVSLIDPGGNLWNEGTAWAAAEPQQAALDALKQTTDPERRVMISLPLGDTEVDPEWADAGLYVELGPEGLLTPLDPVYIRTLRPLHALAVLDAKRLIEQGDTEAGLMRMVDLIRFYRLVRARPSVEEQLESLELMAIAAEQLRDITAYFADRDRLTIDALINTVEALNEDTLRLRRVRWPSIPRIAAEQLLARCYTFQGSVRPDDFALAMARIDAATGSPIRLFSEAARYRFEAPRQADWFDANDMINDVFGNYTLRWEWDINDEDLAKLPSAYDTMNPARYRIIEKAAAGLPKMVPYRRASLVHMSGTRLALATVAYRLARDGDSPRILPNLQPRFVDDIDKNLDLFGYDYDAQRSADFLYFVPASPESMPPNIPPRQRSLYEEPHTVVIEYKSPMEGLLGAGVRGEIDLTSRAMAMLEDGELEQLAERTAGPAADFKIRWFTLDEDGERPGTAVEGSQAPPLQFVNARAEEFNVQQRPGEILVIAVASDDNQGPAFSQRELDQLSLLGFRYHFDGVRVILVGADYAEENLSDPERRILAARLARQIGVVDVALYDENRPLDAAYRLDDESDWTFLIDRTGTVRAAGLQLRHLEDGLLELIEEQPIDFLQQDRAGSGPSPFPLVFRAQVGEDDFVLYSRGMNMRDDRKFGEPHVFDYTGRELLFWPPGLTLQREAR